MLLGAIRDGLTLSEACSDAGLSENTAKTWLKRGRREDATEYAAFSEAVDRAREAAASDAMEEPEFLAYLNAAVRKGSINAMRLWWQVHRDRQPMHEPSELDALDGQVSGNGHDSVIEELARRARRDRPR